MAGLQPASFADDPSLLAYYDFQPKAVVTPAVLPNVSPAGSALDGQIPNGEWVEGRMPGKLALYFYGPGSNGKVVLPDQKRFNFTGPFSVAVWFKVGAVCRAWQALVTKGDDAWRLQQYIANSNCISFDTNADHDQCEVTTGAIQRCRRAMASGGCCAHAYSMTRSAKPSIWMVTWAGAAGCRGD